MAVRAWFTRTILRPFSWKTSFTRVGSRAVLIRRWSNVETWSVTLFEISQVAFLEIVKKYNTDPCIFKCDLQKLNEDSAIEINKIINEPKRGKKIVTLTIGQSSISIINKPSKNYY